VNRVEVAVGLKVFTDDDGRLLERWLARHPGGSAINDARSPKGHTARDYHIDITRGHCALDAAALPLRAEAARRRSPVRCRDWAP
jgi:hypothetical protein